MPGRRVARRTRALVAPGPRRLASAASAAGVVIIAAAIALLATAGAPGVAHAHRSHAAPGAAAALTDPQTAVPLSRALAAYPPRNPCSLTLVRSTSDALTVEGSGLGSAQAVSVVYYRDGGADPSTVGAWRTDRDGTFDGSVQVPDSGFVLARSRSAQCSAPTGPTEPGYPPTTAPTTPPVTSSPPTSSAPTTSAPTTGPTGPTVSPTSSAPSGGSSPTTGSGTSTGGGPGEPPGSSSGTPPTGSGSTTTGSNGGVPGGRGSGATGTASSGSPSSGAGTSAGGTSSPTTPNSSAAPAIPTPAAIGPQSWGLPTSFIITMALVLLVVGGLAVLVLTRRSD